MKKLVDRIFQKYGVRIEINTITGGMAHAQGFVHYTATSARKHLLPKWGPLGEIPLGHCRLLMPCYSVSIGHQVAYDHRWYIVRQVERVWLGNEAVYDRCLCEEKGGHDEWGR